MKKIPKSVKAYISNARYYLESANQFPPLIRDGVRILLLLTARENIKIAEEELHAWVQGLEPSKNLYRALDLKDEQKYCNALHTENIHLVSVLKS